MFRMYAALGSLALLIAFQNCGKSVWKNEEQTPAANSSASSSSSETADIETSAVGNGPIQPAHASLDELKLWRRRIWAANCGPDGGRTWEVCFEGKNIPGDGESAHLFWDNPIDDDWRDPLVRETSLMWNSISSVSGLPILRVDRTLPWISTATGHFWRRDEFLTRAAGLVAEVKMRVAAESLERGVVLHFFDDADAFTLSFDPDSISFIPDVSASAPATATVVRRNTSWTTFTVRKVAGTNEVQVSANGARLFSGTTLKAGSSSDLYSPAAANVGRFAPRIGFGDFSSAVKGKYEVEYFRYRRDGTGNLRTPPSLPAEENCAATPSWNDVPGLGLPATVGATRSSRNALADPKNGEFERSIELKAKLTAVSTREAAFSLYFYDRLGGITLTIFPNQLQMQPAGKPVSPVVSAISGFDARIAHTYRLVRQANGLYWNLYLDQSSIPVLVDVRASGFSDQPFIAMGPFRTPSIHELATGMRYSPFSETGAVADVSYVKWTDHAIAPNHCR